MGTWKSNEELTLNEMKNIPDLTENAKKVFTNKFFGRLVHIYRKKDSATFFIENRPEKLEFMAYEKIDIKERSVTFTSYDEMLKTETSNTLYLEGKCFYVLTSKWQFKEYFCPYVD